MTMSSKENKIIKINSVSELHKLMGIPKPKHPLVSLINYSNVPSYAIENSVKVILNFYTVSIKHNTLIASSAMVKIITTLTKES